MNRRERLMATLKGQPVDRPAVSFYEIGGFQIDPSDTSEFNVYKYPTWQPLLKLAEEQTDIIRMVSPVCARSHEVKGVRDNSAETSCFHQFFTVKEYLEDGCLFVHTTLNVAGRTMMALTKRSPEVDTIWTIEHLLKDTDDLKAYLQLPDEVFTESINIAMMLEEERKLADRGIVMVDTEDPLCAAASLFSMETFTILAFTEQVLFHQLLEKLSRHLYTRTEETSRLFPGRLWRIYGPEYATEPYLSPNLFDEYVVRYTGPMVKFIQEHGGFVRIHSHGKIKNVIDMIASMGADAIDPIEPSPQGDVELSDIRQRYGQQMVLFGNLEITDIENMEPSQFESVVQKTLDDGTRGSGRGFVLMPSASPYGRVITPRVMANYETMVRLATTYA